MHLSTFNPAPGRPVLRDVRVSESGRHAWLWLLAGLLFATQLTAQDPRRMGVTQLREVAQSHIGEGDFKGGVPVFEELILRFENAPEADRQLLEGVYLFLGLGYMQQYGASRDGALLERALETFQTYEQRFPAGERRHLMLVFRADCHRGLSNWEAAATDLIAALSPPWEMRLSEAQRRDALEKLAQALYIRKDWERGIPWFLRLLQTPSSDGQTLAAAALTEAYIATGMFDRIAGLLPYLTGDSPSRYDVRFNLKLLEGGDKLAEEERFIEASLLYYMTLTKDELLDYWSARKARLERRIRQLKAQDRPAANALVGELEVDLINANQQVEVLDEIPSYTPELEWRKARNFKDTGRDWEAYWAFWRLAQDYPERTEHIEDYYYAAFVQADLLNEIEKAEHIANLYLDREDWYRYRREISVQFAGLLLRSEQYERLLVFCQRYIARDPNDAFNPQLVYYMGSTYLKLERYQEGADQFRAYVEQYPKAPMVDGCYYWGGLAMLFTEEYESAIRFFTTIREAHPRSPYFEDAQFRIGVAHFANDGFEEAERIFRAFIDQYPESILRGEGEVFLGDLASADGRVRLAIEHYENVSQYTDDMAFISHATFQLGKLFEANGWYPRMEKLYRAYQEQYGERGRLTAAIFEQGRAFELMGHPEKMLEAYLAAIVRYGDEPTAYGIDRILLAYPEKFHQYRQTYAGTIAFIDAFLKDAAFRNGLLEDRRKMFDYFGEHPEIDADLRERMIRDNAFRESVAADPGVLREIRRRFHTRLNQLPVATPAEAYREAYAQAKEAGRQTLALRLHMALEHLGAPVDPTRIFTERDVELASPQTLVWMARRMASYDNLALRPLIRKALDRVLADYGDAERAVLEALMASGDMAAEDGDFLGALDFYSRAQERFPTDPRAVEAAMRQGDVLMAAERFEDAVERYEKILRTRSWRGPAWAEAQFKIGLCYFERELYSEAHGYFERTFLAFAQYRDWAARAYLKDAETLIRLGARSDALATLEEALATPGYEDTESFGEIQRLRQSLM